MLTISTFNIQNNGKRYHQDKAVQIKKYLEDYAIDFLNLQEMFIPCEKDLLNLLKDTAYKLYGSYRYKLGVMKRINEKTPIMTQKRVLFHKTYHLPFLPSLLKRVVTKVVIQEDDGRKITVLNTHLDYKYDFTKKRQLDFLLKLISKEKNAMIITGDFNLKNNKKIFLDFIENLEKLGIYHVETYDKTLKQSKYKRAIDHIFYSKEFTLLDVKIVKDLLISDHYPVLIKIK